MTQDLTPDPTAASVASPKPRLAGAVAGALLGVVLGALLYLLPGAGLISYLLLFSGPVLGAVVGYNVAGRSAERTTRTKDEHLAAYADTSYFVQRLGRDEGPYTISQVSDLFARREIGGDTAMRRADGGEPFLAREFNLLSQPSGSARLGSWGVAVFLFGWVGGLVGFLMLQDDNRPRAKRVLKWGLIWTGIWLGISVALYIVFFAVLAGI